MHRENVCLQLEFVGRALKVATVMQWVQICGYLAIHGKLKAIFKKQLHLPIPSVKPFTTTCFKF